MHSRMTVFEHVVISRKIVSTAVCLSPSEPAIPRKKRRKKACSSFKLHMVINNKGEVMAVKITAGNTDDREPFDTMTAALEGRIVGNNGYISNSISSRNSGSGVCTSSPAFDAI